MFFFSSSSHAQQINGKILLNKSSKITIELKTSEEMQKERLNLLHSFLKYDKQQRYTMKAIVFISRKIILICSITVISACGGSTETVSIPTDFDAQKIVSAKNQLQKILTKEMVAEVVNIPVEKIEKYIENNLSEKGQFTVLYSWQTGKTKSVSDNITIPEYNSVGIGFIATDDAASFEAKYEGSAGLQQRINKLAEQENFNKEIATAEAKYVSDYAQRRTIEKLANVATAAYWEQPVNALHVLADKVSFTITTNFGDDESLVKKKSIELVKSILNH